MNDNELIKKIRAGDNRIIEKIYPEWMGHFKAWALKSYGCSAEDAQEAYQDAFMVLWQKITDNKMPQITSSLKNYAFGVGKFKLIKRYKATKNEFANEDVGAYQDIKADDFNEVMEKEIMFDELDNAINRLGPNCKKIINGFYFEKQNYETIAERLGYKNADTVKSKKYKCVQKLKTLVFEKTEKV